MLLGLGCGGFGHEFCAATLHFFGSYVFYVRGYAPVMAGGVGDFSVAIAPEHILYGHGALCAGFYRALECGVHVGDI